jgi:diadenosine tetraphosphate (Ap4A) HIT family hydrolase
MEDSLPNDCPFCSMPAERIREVGSHGFVVDDAFPVTPGHTLVISRRHTSSVFDLTLEEMTSLLTLLDSAKKRLDRSLKPNGYNVGVNVGEAAGQTVWHVHLHLIPRYFGDTPDPSGGVRHVIPSKGRYIPG